jgi:hypothetical protein
MDADTPLNHLSYGHMPKTFSGNMSGMMPCRVTGKSGPMHMVDVYRDGIAAGPTGMSQPMLVMGMNLADTLPTGTWLLASPQELAVTGFTEIDG